MRAMPSDPLVVAQTQTAATRSRAVAAMAHTIYNHTFNIIVSIISSININIIAVTLTTIIFITIHNGHGFWRRFM